MNWTKQKIVFIGMPGAGKSTVGHLLSEYLRLPFWDVHEILQALLHKKQAEIIDQHGLPYFIHKENVISEQILRPGEGIVALNPHAVFSPAVRALLKNHRVIYLQGGATVLRARSEPGKRIKDEALLRLPSLCESMASLTIDSEANDPETIAQFILQHWDFGALAPYVAVNIE